MKYFSKSKLAATIALAITSTIPVTETAFAQDDPALEEITVTGTRIRRDDFSNPQPSTVVGGELLDRLSIVNIGDAMRNLPSNVGNNSPTANPGGNFFNGSNIANLRGLNPFFGSRTLTLVDSRRHVPTNQGDGVDLNFIPSILVDRMEVVNGGASATYGSGAVGGVTNILLDTDLTGFKFQVDYGDNFDSDVGGEDKHYAFAWGTEVGESGNFVIGFEGQRQDGIFDCNGIKDWCAEGHEIITNPAYAPDGSGTQPNFIHTNIIDNPNNTDQYTTSGMFPLLGQKANEAGTDVSPYVAASDGRHPFEYNNLQSNIDRDVVFAHYEQQINDNLGFFVEGSVGSVETRTPQNSLDLTFGFLQADNYYLNQLATNPCAATPFLCFVNKDFTDQVKTENHTTTDLKRVAFGFNGELGSDWSWDVYYQWGESDRQQDVLNNRHLHRFNFALDVIDDGAGNPVCRVSAGGALPPGVDPSLANGCVPINVLGTSGISQAGLDYAFGQLLENTIVEQRMLEGQISGELFDGFGAGAVAAAFGASWRDESIDNIPDQSQSDAQRTDYIIQYGEGFDGDVEVFEVFAEVDIPLHENFGVNLAARRSEYENTAGNRTLVPGDSFEYGITTWKATATWDIQEWLTLRASQSRDARAPNFRELYYGQFFPEGNPFAYCDNPWSGNRNQGFFTGTGDSCEWYLQGGIDLSPETADTTTIGLVFTPEIVPVRFAVDMYKVEIEDAITQASVGLTIDSCFELRDPDSCANISGTLLDASDPLGGWSKIDRIEPTAFNFEGYEVYGYDISADWAQDFDFGTVSSRVIASRNIEQLVSPAAGGGLQRDISGTNGSTNGFLADWAAQPDWNVQWITSYLNGPFIATAMMRWVSDGKIYADRFGPDEPGYTAGGVNTIDFNDVGSYSIWSLNGSYNFTVSDMDLQIFGGIENLFDRQPPMGLGGNGTNPTYYDTIGRRFRLGIRSNF